MDTTSAIIAQESTSTIGGVKRPRQEGVRDAGPERLMKFEESRPSMAIAASHEDGRAPGTNDLVHAQQPSPIGTMVQGLAMATPSHDIAVTTLVAGDTLAAKAEEADAAELFTVRSAEAHAPPPPKSRAADHLEDHVSSKTATGSNNCAPAASCIPLDAPMATGGGIPRGQGSAESSASRGAPTLIQVSKENDEEKQALARAVQPGHAGVKKCQVCSEEDRRYCCPRCGKLTCSLSCCVRHKKEERCNGQRDKVGFVSLKDFTDTRLRSGQGKNSPREEVEPSNEDHKEMILDVDGGALGVLAGRNQDWLAGRAPRLQRLVKEAARRGTRLLLMPDGMTRREGNTTTILGVQGRVREERQSERGTTSSASWNLHKQGHGVASSPNQLLEIKTRRETGNGISWKVEWVFSEDAAAATSRENAAEDVRITDEQIPEYCLLHEALSKHLKPKQGNAPLRHRLRSFAKAWVAMNSNDTGQGAGASGDRNQKQAGCLRLFLQRVPCAAKMPLYWELNCLESLAEALKEKTVIEFPTIYVTLVGAGLTSFRTLVSESTVNVGSTCIMDEIDKGIMPPERLGDGGEIGNAIENIAEEEGNVPPEEAEGHGHDQVNEEGDDDDDDDDVDDDDDDDDDDGDDEDDDDDDDVGDDKNDDTEGEEGEEEEEEGQLRQ